MRDDGRKDQAKAIPILEVAQRLGIGDLRRAGVERVGPCPVCGGQDRFGINPGRGLFHCRRCDVGGDGLALVCHVQGCEFSAALDFLLGKADVQPDPAEVARRKAKAEAEEKRRKDYEAKARARAIRDAREIWHAARPGENSLAAAYLAGRGIRFPEWPPTLRFLPDHPYRKHWPGKGVVEWHRGPCMIAAIQDGDGRIRAVHQTWIDPAQPGQKAGIIAPDGSLVDAKGKPWPAKLVRGSKKGGAIRLSPLHDANTMVMGEGIETTASALVHGVLPGAVFWAGVDLGNMGGRQEKVEGVRDSGLPDLSDAEAWLPPAGITRLVFIQDGDSDPKATRAKLLSGLRRAQAYQPGLEGLIVAAEPGKDLNDMRMECVKDDV